PVRPGLFEHTERDFGEIFGVFNYSLPDGWGLLLMDREFRRRGRALVSVTVLDRFAYIGATGMGALKYHPAARDIGEHDEELDLELLARAAERVLEGEAADVLPELLRAGGSPGGAGPKVVVGVGDDGRIISGALDLPPGYRPYLIKFPAQQDDRDAGALEYAYALMAGATGIRVPATRLFETTDGNRYFGAERFDRPAGRRVHMHSLSGLLHASHRLPSMDYEGLLRATLVLTNDFRQMEEAYRRMVFNVLAHNRDDHVKNFSYLMDRTGEWTFSPAYDLTFSPGPGGRHTMAVAGADLEPGEADMLRVAADAGLKAKRAQEIIAEVREVVRQWRTFAREAGVSRAAEKRVAAVIAPARRR
ncbi:MAG: type II toxin-antitoxin system HipA family toxin, partial [Gemmatimonadota bacterium]